MRTSIGLVVCLSLSVTAQGADILYFSSSPTSWVGQGETRWVTPADGFSFHGTRYFNQGAYTNAADLFISSANEYWGLTLVGAELSFPTPGHYLNATRWPFQDLHQPGLDFSGNGRGNNTLTGEFTVYESSYDLSGNLLSFAADFVQYDKGNQRDWVTGGIRFHSNVPVPAPEPATLVLAAAGLVGAAIYALGRWLGRRTGPN